MTAEVWARAGYLLLDTTPVVLAFRAANVLDVARVSEAKLETSLELTRLLQIAFSAPEPVWKLRIGDAARSILTVFRGRLHIEYLASNSLLAMPALRKHGFELFSDIVMAKGEPSALVVNTNALLLSHEELGTQ